MAHTGICARAFHGGRGGGAEAFGGGTRGVGVASGTGVGLGTGVLLDVAMGEAVTVAVAVAVKVAVGGMAVAVFLTRGVFSSGCCPGQGMGFWNWS